MNKLWIVVLIVPLLVGCNRGAPVVPPTKQTVPVLIFETKAQVKQHVVARLNHAIETGKDFQSTLEADGFTLYPYRDSLNLIMQYINAPSAPAKVRGWQWCVEISVQHMPHDHSGKLKPDTPFVKVQEPGVP